MFKLIFVILKVIMSLFVSLETDLSRMEGSAGQHIQESYLEIVKKKIQEPIT